MACANAAAPAPVIPGSFSQSILLRSHTRRMWIFGKARCVYRAREQGATTSNSKLYWEESQRGYRVREACIAAENSRVTGIYLDRQLP